MTLISRLISLTLSCSYSGTDVLHRNLAVGFSMPLQRFRASKCLSWWSPWRSEHLQLEQPIWNVRANSRRALHESSTVSALAPANPSWRSTYHSSCHVHCRMLHRHEPTSAFALCWDDMSASIKEIGTFHSLLRYITNTVHQEYKNKAVAWLGSSSMVQAGDGAELPFTYAQCGLLHRRSQAGPNLASYSACALDSFN
ncbi:hypothetical protein BDR06DRAFT_602504 [Suillus hirtellus]|nr:hypothetical protein BDR06DRAFT_602504 [Suillus hirtellus]